MCEFVSSVPLEFFFFNSPLFLRRHVPQQDSSGFQFFVADDNDGPCAQFICQPHLALQAAGIEIQVHTSACVSQSTRQQRCAIERGLAECARNCCNEILRPVIGRQSSCV